MTKVCHITTVHLAFDVRIFHKECKTLAKAGYEVYLIAKYDKKEIVEGVHIIPLPKVKNRLKRMFFLPLMAFWKALILKADIYHFHDPELIPTGLLLKMMRKKVIFDSHEDVPLQVLSKPYLKENIRRIISKIYTIFEKFSCKYFDAIICATDSIKEKFLKINPLSIEVRNYPLLSELNYVSNDREEKNNEVCYIGGISEIRGIKQILIAMEYLDSVKLNLAGNFESKELEKEVKSMEGWKKVNYYGFVDREKVYEIMTKSKIGIVTFLPLPNHINSQPNKIFEYMAAGLPVVASNFPLWRKIVEGNNCGICVDPLNPKEIASAIIYILEHPEEAKKMGENGRKAVLQKCNWEKEGEKLIGLYKEILNEGWH